VILLLTGCGASLPAPQPLAVRAVDWNPTHVEVGRVTAVADRGTEVAVFSEGAATVLDAGAVTVVDRAVARWTSAATIAAADGSGTWLVGIDGDGRVRRLRGRAGFEDVSARWGLEHASVLDVATSPRGAVFVILPALSSQSPYMHPPPELAVADGARVAHFSGITPRAVAAGGGVIACATTNGVVTASGASTRRFPLEPILDVAVDDAGKVYAATPDAVYAEDDKGELVLRARAALGPIHGLVASKGRVWFAEGQELGVIEAGQVLATSGAKVAPEARLWPSTSGDVWVIARGRLLRFARDAPAGSGPVRDAWLRDVEPVFARACAKCHSPGGPAGVDLSTFDAWRAKTSDIKERVLDARTMPPKGHPLADADREQIRRWVDAAR
jgi:mono/diheme cytochrome c family protein